VKKMAAASADGSDRESQSAGIIKEISDILSSMRAAMDAAWT